MLLSPQIGDEYLLWYMYNVCTMYIAKVPV